MAGKRGQVSAELIIILAAVLAVSLILVIQLQKSSEKAGNQVQKETDKIFDSMPNAADVKTTSDKKEDGEDCSKDADCKSGYCNYAGKCA